MKARLIVLACILSVGVTGPAWADDMEDPGKGGEVAEKGKAATCRFLLKAILAIDDQIQRLSQIATLDNEQLKELCEDREAGVHLYDKQKCDKKKIPRMPKQCQNL